MKYCVYCGREITGNQRKFCCDLHKCLWWYRIFEEEISKQGRSPNVPGAWDYVKNAALALSGYKCQRCGKDADAIEDDIRIQMQGESEWKISSTIRSHAVFEVHHIIPLYRATVNLAKNHQQTIISFAGATA